MEKLRLMLPRTLSIVGALVLLKRRAGKKMRAQLLGLPKYNVTSEQEKMKFIFNNNKNKQRRRL